MKRLARLQRFGSLALLSLIVPALLAACGSGSSPTVTSAVATVSSAATKVAPTVGAAASAAGPTVASAATSVAPTVAAVASAAGPTVAAAATTTAPTVAAVASAAGGASPAAAKTGGQLVVGADMSDAITFDPAHFYETVPEQVMLAAYEPLVAQYPPDMTKTVPVLAKEVPTTQNGGISADGKTYTFKLRDNIKFHSGNPMTADDWVFSMKRLRNVSDNPSFLTDPFSTKDAVNVAAPDKGTLVFTLNEPNVTFFFSLATANTVVVDSKAVKEKGGTDAANAKDADKAKDFLDQNSAGTGPYILKSFKLKDEIVVEKNPNYWDAGNAAKLDRIVFKNINNSGTARQQLEAGTIDVAQSLDPDAVADLQKSGKYTIITGNTLALDYLAMSVDPTIGGPLANKQVRQAIGYAIDYKGIIDGLRKGAAVQPPSIVPQGLLSVDKAQQYAYKTDINKAKDLLKQAGMSGQTIKLTFSSGASLDGVQTETLAAKLKADIEQIGLKVDLVPQENQQRLADFRAAKLQMTFSGWTPDFADVHSYAEPFGKTGSTAAKRVKYSNPKVDDLLAQGLKESDPAKRSDIYLQIQQILIDEAPFLPLYQPTAQYVLKKTVTNYNYHPVYFVDYRQVGKTG